MGNDFLQQQSPNQRGTRPKICLIGNLYMRCTFRRRVLQMPASFIPGVPEFNKEFAWNNFSVYSTCITHDGYCIKQNVSVK